MSFKLIKLTLSPLKSTTYINVDDIVEVRAYSGQLNTFRMEANDVYGSESPYKMVASEPTFIENGTMIFLRNVPLERIVTESLPEVIHAITEFRKTRS